MRNKSYFTFQDTTGFSTLRACTCRRSVLNTISTSQHQPPTTGQRDFYFACGIFVWAIPRPWSSRSSNIDVRQTSITSHLTTFYHVACVAGFKREKGKGGNSGAPGMGWRAPDFPSSPFPLSTPARRLSEAHVAAVFVVTQCGAELCMT